MEPEFEKLAITCMYRITEVLLIYLKIQVTTEVKNRENESRHAKVHFKRIKKDLPYAVCPTLKDGIL